MRSRRFILIILVVAGLFDLDVFQAVRTIAHEWSPRWRIVLYSLYWALSVLALGTMVLTPYLGSWQYSRAFTYVNVIILGIYIAKLVAGLFLLVDDIRRLIQ